MGYAEESGFGLGVQKNRKVWFRSVERVRLLFSDLSTENQETEASDLLRLF